jgi:hypothetical protein
VKRSLKKNKAYAKAKRRVRYEKERHKQILARKLSQDMHNRIFVLEQAISGKTGPGLECLLQGDKEWNEMSQYQQGQLFRQATVVLELLKLVNAFVGGKQKWYINEIRNMVCEKCPFHLTPARLAKWHKDLTANGDKCSECLTGKLKSLSPPRLKKRTNFSFFKYSVFTPGQTP